MLFGTFRIILNISYQFTHRNIPHLKQCNKHIPYENLDKHSLTCRLGSSPLRVLPPPPPPPKPSMKQIENIKVTKKNDVKIVDNITLTDKFKNTSSLPEDKTIQKKEEAQQQHQTPESMNTKTKPRAKRSMKAELNMMHFNSLSVCDDNSSSSDEDVGEDKE